jgi:hypothetical protein
MAVNVSKTLRQALATLTGEKEHLDRQIDAIAVALHALDGRPRAAGSRPVQARRRKVVRKTKRRAMSRAARKAVGERMKAYWAKRKGAGKSKATKRAAGKGEN